MTTGLSLQNFRLSTSIIDPPPPTISSPNPSPKVVAISPPSKSNLVYRKWISENPFGNSKCARVVSEILVALYTSFNEEMSSGDQQLMKKLDGALQYELDLVHHYQTTGKRRDYRCILDMVNYAGAAGSFPLHTYVPTEEIILFARLNGYDIQVSCSSLSNGLERRSFGLARPPAFEDGFIPYFSPAFQNETFIYEHWLPYEENLTIAKHIINMMVVAYSTNLVPLNSSIPFSFGKGDVQGRGLLQKVARDTMERLCRPTIRNPVEDVLAYCNQCARAGNYPEGYHVPTHAIITFAQMSGYEIMETIIPPENDSQTVVRYFQIAYST
jgi:hypothetical protein